MKVRLGKIKVVLKMEPLELENMGKARKDGIRG